MKAVCMIPAKGFVRGTIYTITMLLEGMGRMYVLNEKGKEVSFCQDSPVFEIL